MTNESPLQQSLFSMNGFIELMARSPMALVEQINRVGASCSLFATRNFPVGLVHRMHLSPTALEWLDKQPQTPSTALASEALQLESQSEREAIVILEARNKRLLPAALLLRGPLTADESPQDKSEGERTARQVQPRLAGNDGLKTAQPAEDANGLGYRECKILAALFGLHATSSEARTTRAAIVATAKLRGKAVSYKATFSGLRKRGLIRTERGAAGGVWLTPAGCSEAQNIRQR